jgi:hypothetical protein
MRPIYQTRTLAAASANSIALSQKPLAAGALTLNGASVVNGVAILGAQRKVVIASDANDSGHTFVITGTDDQGHIITETLTGPNTATVTSVMDYSTVTSITISAAATGNLTAGTSAVGAGPVIPLDKDLVPFNVMMAVILALGAANFTVQYTFDDIWAAYGPGGNPNGITWWNDADITAAAASSKGSLINPVTAVRLLTNSGTGTLNFQIIQQGAR